MSGAIHKARRRPEPLTGRRVQVPQRYTDVEDDGDGFCFGGSVVHSDEHRVLIRFDYTGDVESWPLALARTWLEPDLEPLCLALSSSALEW
jgi:hypothetical protein